MPSCLVRKAFTQYTPLASSRFVTHYELTDISCSKNEVVSISTFNSMSGRSAVLASAAGTHPC